MLTRSGGLRRESCRRRDLWSIAQRGWRCGRGASLGGGRSRSGARGCLRSFIPAMATSTLIRSRPAPIASCGGVVVTVMIGWRASRIEPPAKGAWYARIRTAGGLPALATRGSRPIDRLLSSARTCSLSFTLRVTGLWTWSRSVPALVAGCGGFVARVTNGRRRWPTVAAERAAPSARPSGEGGRFARGSRWCRRLARSRSSTPSCSLSFIRLAMGPLTRVHSAPDPAARFGGAAETGTNGTLASTTAAAARAVLCALGTASCRQSARSRSSIPSSSRSSTPVAMGVSIRSGWAPAPTSRCGGVALWVTNGRPLSRRAAEEPAARYVRERGCRPLDRSPSNTPS